MLDALTVSDGDASVSINGTVGTYTNGFTQVIFDRSNNLTKRRARAISVAKPASSDVTYELNLLAQKSIDRALRTNIEMFSHRSLIVLSQNGGKIQVRVSYA